MSADMSNESQNKPNDTPQSSPSSHSTGGAKKRTLPYRIIQKLRQTSTQEEIRQKLRLSFKGDGSEDYAEQFQQALDSGDAKTLTNHMLELKRAIELERKTKRLSYTTFKYADAFFELCQRLIERKKSIEQYQKELEIFQTEQKRKQLSPNEQIKVRQLITQLRKDLQTFQTQRDKTRELFHSLCRLRSKEIHEENSLRKSIEKYLQYVEGPQRARIEIQMKEKMKNMPYEHRVHSLQTFIQSLIQTSPSILQAEVERLIELAIDLFVNEHLDDAIAQLHKAADYQPENEEIYTLLAQCWEKKQERDKAIQNYKKACQCKPDDPKLLILLAQAYENNQKINLAILNYKKALDIQPANFALLTKLARLSFDSERWKVAIPLLLQIIDRKPHSLKTLKRLGIALIRTSEYDRGISILKNYIQRQGTDNDVDFALGLAYRSQGFYHDAFQHFKTAWSNDQTNLEFHYWYAMAHFDRGDYDEAESLARLLLQRNYEPIQTVILLAQSLRRLGKNKQAVDVIKPYIENGSKKRDLLLEYGHDCLAAGMADEAYQKLQSLVNLYPSDEEIRQAFGLACIQSKRFQEAVHYITPLAG